MNYEAMVLPVLGLLAFTLVWTHFLKFLESIKPGWRKAPNYFSVALVLGITLFATQTLGAILLDPLAMDKIQVGLLSGVFDASNACKDAGHTPILGLECKMDSFQGVVNYSDYSRIGVIPYGEDPACKCEWALKSKEVLK